MIDSYFLSAHIDNDVSNLYFGVHSSLLRMYVRQDTECYIVNTLSGICYFADLDMDSVDILQTFSSTEEKFKFIELLSADLDFYGHAALNNGFTNDQVTDYFKSII